MQRLIDLLKELNFETDSINEKFSIIAKELMCNYQILSVSTEAFNIHEIEFYFFSLNHPDSSVHRHNLKAGQWRVHYSGIDITFDGCAVMNEKCKNKKCKECKDLSSYGGILIRSIGNSKNFIVGPLRVQTTLLSGGSISETKGISLIKVENCNNINELKTSTRCGVKGLQNFYNDKRYCYYNADILKDAERNDGTKYRILIK